MNIPVDKDTCPDCEGKGYHLKLDLMQAKHVKKRCDKCRGRGNLKAAQTGVRMRALRGHTIIFDKVISGQVVSSLRLFCWPCDPHKPLVIGDIVRMYTNPKQERKGHMTQVINSIKQIKHVAGMRTSWTDSSASGRALLLKLGFMRKGHLLLWENPHAKIAIPRIREIIEGAAIDGAEDNGEQSQGQGTDSDVSAVQDCAEPEREPHREGNERAPEVGPNGATSAPGVP